MSALGVAAPLAGPQIRVGNARLARSNAASVHAPVVSRLRTGNVTSRRPSPPSSRRDVRAAANRDSKESRNPSSVGAISDANATHQGSFKGSWDDLLNDDCLAKEVNGTGVNRDNARSTQMSDDATRVEASLRNSRLTDDSDSDSTGFFVRKERHESLCVCSVCTSLRELVSIAPTPTEKLVGTVSLNNNKKQIKQKGGANYNFKKTDPVLVAFDGGFVVGKQQQKHHVLGCHCPNCNNLRFRADNGISKIVSIEKELLFDLVGESDCFQQVLSAQTEIDRRLKIGAANKGKSAWNKGRHHSPETIAKIKANTAKAMKDPDVKRRMREAAAKTFHSVTTKMKIRRTVRDTAHKKMELRNRLRSEELGVRRGKVGTVSIGTYARRVSSVQQLFFGVWSKHAIDKRDLLRKEELKAFKKIEREERKRLSVEEKQKLRELKGVKARTTRGVPKTPEHKAAISAALKAKWNDPSYVSNQSRAMKARRSTAGKARAASQKEKRDAIAARTPLSDAEKKRHKLVGEMKNMYTKASVAVKALEKRKSSGLEVDEVMLKKALSAVSETRKVLESLGQAAVPIPHQSAALAAAKAQSKEEVDLRVVHVVDGEEVEAQESEVTVDDGLDVV